MFQIKNVTTQKDSPINMLSKLVSQNQFQSVTLYSFSTIVDLWPTNSLCATSVEAIKKSFFSKE